MKFPYIILILFLVYPLVSCQENQNKTNNSQTQKTCTEISCNNHGTCKMLNGETYCECENGYTNGENKLTCVKNNDNCNNKCLNFEICIKNECKLKENACYDQNDCPDGFVCTENYCINHQFKLEGLYQITGNDGLGTYTGKIQIIPENDYFKIIRITEYDDAEFEGLKIATANTGKIIENEARIKLYRKGFITKYNNTVKDKNTPFFTICKTEIIPEENTIEANFKCENAIDFDFSETWEKISDNTSEIIWKNERKEIETHPEIPQREKEIRFNLYKSFHELDEVKPYTARNDFKRAMHFYIYDPTDLKYYRENPDKVRVIQKTIDNISLKESKQRRDAYYMTLKQKQQIYENEMQEYFLNDRSMYSNFNTDTQTHNPSGDGLLWTGVYIASQSMRYLKTSSQEALDNLLKSLESILTCFYITDNDATFARTIRESQENSVICSGLEEEDNGKWCKGSGIYENTDYLMSGNNDMFKGYIVAFPWAYKALKKARGHNNTINKMKDVIYKLVKNNKVAKDGKINEFLSYLMLYMFEDNFFKKQEYKTRYKYLWDLIADPWLVDRGNGAKYDYGTADWSGTHLNIQTLISAYIIFDEIEDNDKKQAIRLGFKRALENMRFTNQGLFQLAASTLGDFNEPPIEQKYSLWYLQSYIAPKKNINFDWRINPEFCVSPYPNLPWKNDWISQNGHRINSLRMYPNFEQNVDDYMFKSSPMSFKGSESNTKQGGADFLFAYWFARYFNVINEED